MNENFADNQLIKFRSVYTVNANYDQKTLAVNLPRISTEIFRISIKT